MKKLKILALVAFPLLTYCVYSAFKIHLTYPESFSLRPKKNLVIELSLDDRLCSPQKISFANGQHPLPAKLLNPDSANNYKYAVDVSSITSSAKIDVQHSLCFGTAIDLASDTYTREEVAAKIIAEFIKLNPSDTISYNWTSAVLLLGMVDYVSEHTEQKEIADYLDAVFLRLNAVSTRVTSPDLAAIALPATAYKKLHRTANVDSILKNTLQFLQTEPRNELGALNHVGHEHRFFSFLPMTKNFVGDSIWADSIVMYGLTSLKLSETLENPELLNFSAQQPVIFSDKLQTNDGFFKHAYYFEKQNLTPVHSYWGRGNGWMALALITYLEDPRVNPEIKARLRQVFKKQIAAFTATLNTIYISKTLLLSTSTANYYETSSTCLFGYALARGYRLGFLNEDSLEVALQIEKSVRGFITIKDDTWLLQGISRATDSFDYDWYYTHIPVAPDISYGIGAYLLFMNELHKNEAASQKFLE